MGVGDSKMGLNVGGKIKEVVNVGIYASILIPLVIAVYPMLTTALASLNTTFNNGFTNFLAGNSGIIAFVLSTGVGYLVLMLILDTFMKKGGK